MYVKRGSAPAGNGAVTYASCSHSWMERWSIAADPDGYRTFSSAIPFVSMGHVSGSPLPDLVTTAVCGTRVMDTEYSQ